MSTLVEIDGPADPPLIGLLLQLASHSSGVRSWALLLTGREENHRLLWSDRHRDIWTRP